MIGDPALSHGYTCPSVGLCVSAVAPIPHFRSEGFVVQELVSLLPLVGIALLFWLLLIRPASRRQKALAGMQSALNVGDQVMLTSGFHGTLTGLGDDFVEVAIAEGVTVKVARGAVGSVVAPESHESTELEHPDAEER